jgi:hypothetical protein
MQRRIIDLDEFEAPVLEGTTVVAMKDNVRVVSILTHTNLNALVRVLPVDDAIPVKHPHLRAVPGNVRVHDEAVPNTFAVEYKV